MAAPPSAVFKSIVQDPSRNMTDLLRQLTGRPPGRKYLPSCLTPLNDIDVIFFDRSDIKNRKAKRAQALLYDRDPAIKWAVQNTVYSPCRNLFWSWFVFEDHDECALEPG